MLNPFPIQFLALFAYFILRIFVGGILLWLGIKILRTRVIPNPHGIAKRPITLYLLAVAEIAIGIFTLLGAATQYAMLGLFVLCVAVLCTNPQRNVPYIPSPIFYLLLLACSISLFITGAGFPAVDLPI